MQHLWVGVGQGDTSVKSRVSAPEETEEFVRSFQGRKPQTERAIEIHSLVQISRYLGL